MRGRFTYTESRTSSTFRELLAVKYTVSSLSTMLKGQSVLVNVDNFSASRILLIGSAKSHLQELALSIFKFCLAYDIRLVPKWVPREKNTVADAISKSSDTDDWSIDNATFAMLNRLYGPFTVDRFADDLNKKVVRFNSKFHCPGTEAVDAFTETWSGDNNWLCPPISLIGSVIRHLALCRASGTLLVPVWPSAYFWVLIYPNGLQMANFVKSYRVVDPFYRSTGNNRVFVGRPKFKAIALKCVFN